MEAETEWRRIASRVRGSASDGKTTVTELVVKLEEDPERVGRLRMEHTRERGLIRRSSLEGPGQPSHQAVNGVVMLRLVERRFARPGSRRGRSRPRSRLGQGASTCPLAAGVDLVGGELPDARARPGISRSAASRPLRSRRRSNSPWARANCSPEAWSTAVWYLASPHLRPNCCVTGSGLGQRATSQRSKRP